MKELKVHALGLEENLVRNVVRYMNKNYDFYHWNEDDAVDYINEHAGDGDHCEVYVGTYAKYNNGSLFGMWVNMESFDIVEEFKIFCKAIHGNEEDPELMYQDYHNFPHNLYSESGMADSFEAIQQYATLDYDADALDAWIDDLQNDDFENFTECYIGEFDSEKDFAEQIFEDCHAHKYDDFILQYIDYEKFARELFSEGYEFCNGYVFRTC